MSSVSHTALSIAAWRTANPSARLNATCSPRRKPPRRESLEGRCHELHTRPLAGTPRRFSRACNHHRHRTMRSATLSSPITRGSPSPYPKLPRRTIMTRRSDYAIVRLRDGRFRLDRTTAPSPGAVAYAKPVTDREGGQIGWRLQPIVVVQGSRSKIWPSAGEALASTRLLTPAAARRLIDDASTAATEGLAR